jgi:Flp pilus assembly pilin Flp
MSQSAYGLSPFVGYRPRDGTSGVFVVDVGKADMGWISRFRNRDDGAQLVEFALLAPLLLLLVLGIVELGWVFSQNNDVRHGAREGARAAAVNLGDNGVIRAAACDSMDLTSPVTVQFTDSANQVAGEYGTVEVIATPDSLSGLGFIEVFLPDTLTSNVEFRLEQDSVDWNSDGGPMSC